MSDNVPDMNAAISSTGHLQLASSGDSVDAPAACRSALARPKLDTSRCFRIALTIGYMGTRYRGLQVQYGKECPTFTDTVEGMLLAALDKVGALELEQPGHRIPRNVRFMRACRTDKGVHAVRNVLAFFVSRAFFASGARDEVNSLAGLLNEALPQGCGIHVFSAQRVRDFFCPKNHCRSRVYQYLLPAFALTPEHPDSWDALLSKLGHDEIVAGAEQFFADWPSDVQEKDIFLTHWRSGFGLGAGDPPEGGLGFLQCLRRECERLHALLVSSFTGTHRFHNFTDDSSPTKVIHPREQQSLRHIRRVGVSTRLVWTRVRCEKPGGDLQRHVPFVVVQLEADSFLLHMIRKMMGTVLAIHRGIVRETLITDALSPTKRVCTPLAPGEFLLLHAPCYRTYDADVVSKYNVRRGRGYDFVTFSYTFLRTAGSVDDFLRNVVYREVSGNSNAATMFIRMTRMHNWKVRDVPERFQPAVTAAEAQLEDKPRCTGEAGEDFPRCAKRKRSSSASHGGASEDGEMEAGDAVNATGVEKCGDQDRISDAVFREEYLGGWLS